MVLCTYFVNIAYSILVQIQTLVLLSLYSFLLTYWLENITQLIQYVFQFI